MMRECASVRVVERGPGGRSDWGAIGSTTKIRVPSLIPLSPSLNLSNSYLLVFLLIFLSVSNLLSPSEHYIKCIQILNRIF